MNLIEFVHPLIPSIFLYINSDNKIVFRASNSIILESSNSINLDSWNFIAIKINREEENGNFLNSNVSIYLNGNINSTSSSFDFLKIESILFILRNQMAVSNNIIYLSLIGLSNHLYTSNELNIIDNDWRRCYLINEHIIKKFKEEKHLLFILQVWNKWKKSLKT